MIDIIQQNPVISFFIALVPIITGIWKVMDMLFVKPRDFRISVLEKNVDDIRKELQKNDINQLQGKVSTQITHEILEKKESDKIEKIIESTSLLNDMDLFYESWKDEKLTDLQRDQFEKNYIEQKVVWVANFLSVKEERDGYLWVSLTSKNKKHYGVHVIAIFDKNHREALLTINKDELVTVSGIIDSFSLSPLIKKCNLSKKNITKLSSQ